VADINRFWLTVNDAAPEKLKDMSDDTLAACHAYFVEAQYELGAGQDRMIRAAEGRVALLNDEVRLRATERGSKNRHTESIHYDRKILRWTRWAVAVGVAVPIVVALIAEIPFSKFLRATASRPLEQSAPSVQPTAAPSQTPPATQSPSIAPQTSQTPAESSTPAP
jgi:hypothetical protein